MSASDSLVAAPAAASAADRLDAMARQRQGRSGQPMEAAALAQLDRQAAADGDTEWLLARIAAQQERLDAAADDVSWMGPQVRHSPAEALQRIRTLCAVFPDLYGAMLAVQLTHASVSREILALAIKRFRRDTEALSVEDLQGLLIAALNGGQQGFDAVLRTRRSGERKPVALPWGRDTD